MGMVKNDGGTTLNSEQGTGMVPGMIVTNDSANTFPQYSIYEGGFSDAKVITESP